MKKSITLLYVLTIISLITSVFGIFYFRRDNGKVEEPKSVVLKQENGYLLWKYNTDGDDKWNTLLNLAELKGVDGKDGLNGLDGLKGINGLDGLDGLNGKDGKDGKDVTNGQNGTNGRDGTDGRDGADGRDGTDGQDGKQVEFRISGTILQWKYTTDDEDSWIDLIDLLTLLNNVNTEPDPSSGSEPNSESSDLVASVNGNTESLGCFTNGEECSVGTAMEIKINSQNVLGFHVISDDGENITLLADANIGNDNIKTTYWAGAGVGNNAYGPYIVLNNLNILTADWENIEELNYTYNMNPDYGTGYKTLSIVDGVASIIGADDNVTTVDDKDNDVTIKGVSRARLLTYEEAYDLGCRTTYSTSNCPAWVTQNLENTTSSLNPLGYWLLSSQTNVKNAYNIKLDVSSGNLRGVIIGSNSTYNNTQFGIRPVITISAENRS